MSKFYGKIGYGKTIDTGSGIWEEQIIEKEYSGDIIKNVNKIQSSNDINDGLSFTNIISIVADLYANENFQYMKYVIFKGMKRKILELDIQYPRIILTIGGVYNKN